MEGFLDSLPTMAVNAGVFVGMVIVTLLGGKFAMKAKEPVVTADPTKIVGGLLQDSYSVLMAAEANKTLADRVERNTNCLGRNIDAMKEMTHELERLNRNIERLKDL